MSWMPPSGRIARCGGCDPRLTKLAVVAGIVGACSGLTIPASFPVLNDSGLLQERELKHGVRGHLSCAELTVFAGFRWDCELPSQDAADVTSAESAAPSLVRIFPAGQQGEQQS